jgi:hypothetical protein
MKPRYAKITTTRRAKRETAVMDWQTHRPLVVELFPFHCGIRVKGTREFRAVKWDAILDLGRKLDDRDQQRQKLMLKKGA